MLRTEHEQFFAVLNRAMAEYMKSLTPAELEAWWMTCKVFTLRDVERALAAHAMDSDDGKRAPRPIDVKRRLVSGTVEREQRMDPNFEERVARHLEMCKRSPSVIATAHAIALKHGNRPWQGTQIEDPRQ